MDCAGKYGMLSLSALLVIATVGAPESAWAQDDPCDAERNAKSVPLDESTWRRLNRIYELAGEERYDEAHEELLLLQERARSDYLQALVSQALGQVYWARDDYDAALQSFEFAIDLDALPDHTHFPLLYQVAQLYYLEERYTEALDAWSLWFCKSPPEKITAGAWAMKASIHARAEAWPLTVEAIDRAIAMAGEPREHWYQLRLAAYFELQDMPAAAQTLEAMIRFWPDNGDYWLQLSNVHLKLGQGDRAMSVAALAWRKNLLTRQSDVLYLSNLYSLEGLPYKAALVLQEGIQEGLVEPSRKHWTMAADAWYTAAELEKALAAYGHAGRLALDGETDLRRGYILVDLERWEEAREALKQAIGKGGIGGRQLGEAHLMAGISEFNLGNYGEAGEAWNRAGAFEHTRIAAEQWMNHLREELARRESSPGAGKTG